ncbi:phytoene desaturase family protein [Chlorobium ferrooxidans]|uniref:Amine oxidase:FAD dependent oxidoreductase n=1 Tax=Chlorobium ferrooxidans DSM 13031 TaxID=377431 RepID=Q0YSF3_9CHLB|nr:NAD(P)/FAD-dependent oxidoreductase [Chlorobium ferrooxidans]EAT59246.1 Amine oxidase:FAD dependent oxidoreductase [Chlorobium ferrooxidans DSM 13031]
MELKDLNVVVIGAGIGGLAAGALLADKGALVTVLEAQEYPGGCAATFSRNGYRFDAGATIGCGFHPGGPMELLGRELGIVWPASQEPVAWQYRHKALHLDLTRDRREIMERFPRSAAFWAEQAGLSKLLWTLAKGGLSWPPKAPRDFARLASKAVGGLPGTLHLLKYASRTAFDWLKSHSLDTDPDFVRFIDSQLLISVQTTSRHANAINAAIALDLPVSGTYALKGGIGTVAELLAASIVKNGGAVLYGKKVDRIDSVRRQVFGLETSDGSALAADVVLVNLTPASLSKLSEEAIDLPVLNSESREWSAFVLYLGMEPELFTTLPTNHIQIIGEGEELAEGNSIFVSASPPDDPGRAPEGLCAVTVSTHTRPEQWFEAKKRGGEAYMELKSLYTRRVLDLFSEQFPAAREAVRSMSAATPVSWERYTGRVMGCVGGYPQISLFRVRGPRTRFDNLLLVGDSIFPGQSLPGVVTGARRAVELVSRQAAKIRM